MKYLSEELIAKMPLHNLKRYRSSVLNWYAGKFIRGCICEDLSGCECGSGTNVFDECDSSIPRIVHKKSGEFWDEHQRMLGYKKMVNKYYFKLKEEQDGS